MSHPEHQRRAYLQAMGIDVWLSRDAAEPDTPTDEQFDSPGAEGLDWDELRICVAECTRCELSASRTKTVCEPARPIAGFPRTKRKLKSVTSF